VDDDEKRQVRSGSRTSSKVGKIDNFYHEAFLFILYADKKYKTSDITTVSSKQLYIKRSSPNLFLEFFISFFTF